MTTTHITTLRTALETAYINGATASSLAYRPQFVSNNHKEGKKVLSSVEDELLACDQFQISVAFITMSGITPLLQTLKELEKKNIPGEILTTNYLNFSEPRALKKLNELQNLTLKMYDVEAAKEGFHTKGYIFKKEEIYRIIIGSSNITSAALTYNREWNTKIVSTEDGEMAREIVQEFDSLWNSKYALDFDTFYESYREKYKIIKHQRDVAKLDDITSIEKYKLEPNSMQVGFIKNLRKIQEAGERKALLISATGTGKTYASAFAMRELGFQRVLFLVHRNQIAKQAKKSFRKVFSGQVSMGLVTGKYQEYDKDFIFATIQTLSKEENLQRYEKTAFDAIVIDEAHHSAANSYKKVLDYFEPKLWLGMTATPDKRDDNLEGRNIYEIFNHQIAYEIRLQDAMEEDLLCPFHYFGITDLDIIADAGKSSEEKVENFRYLTSEERVENVMKQAEYFGYSGDRVKGLIFCSRIDEATKTIISSTTGRRTDRTDYPITAVREAIINALVHRDYSIHTEGMPIQLIMFEDRIEIHNPGGLYGRITIDQLGKIQPDTRNPVLASALETLGITENRYSGIPTIRMEMEKYNLRQPEFLDERGSFIVKLYKESKNDYEDMSNDEETNNLIVFCKTPRTRKEICDYLGLNSVTYAIQTYVNPLVEAGVIKLSIPDKPKSPKQLYYSGEREK